MADAAAAHARLTLDGLLPMPYRALLPYAQLNAVQSRCFDAVVASSRSIAVAAPTGCGKTGVFDLAVVRLLLERDGVPGFGAGGAGAGGKVSREPANRVVIRVALRACALTIRPRSADRTAKRGAADSRVVPPCSRAE